uniref:Uncharacterized protein n=1 Tax=Picea glauca TaxID=3330 RepID=A0A101M3R2_PICGL|nr:hypothetical protein ABT39_MTgene180 [Picea glauca]
MINTDLPQRTRSSDCVISTMAIQTVLGGREHAIFASRRSDWVRIPTPSWGS